ncbi:MAG TPA: hypothetical protein VFA92_01960, partial [Candidatus Binatia bacterium]|nr:hypothetical protein [Candidatus Binatia bacterium]
MTGAPASTGLWERLEREIASRDGGRARLDVWRRLSELVDPGEFRPKLAPYVEIKFHELKWGNSYAVLANPRDFVHYQLAPRELEIVKMMDGTRTVKEIVLERFQESGDLDLAEVADLTRMLYRGNFLDRRFVNTDAAVRRALDPVSVARHKARTFARSLTIEWSDAHGFVKWLHDHGLKVFFTRP